MVAGGEAVRTRVSVSRTSRRAFLKNVAAASSVAALPSILAAQTGRAETPPAGGARELKTDVLIIGGSLGGIPPLWPRRASAAPSS